MKTQQSANQTPLGTESVRVNFNTWERNGFQVSGGSPVLTGGMSSPYIYGLLDIAAPVEVNSSNVLTANGGHWQTYAASFTGQVLTGTPTLTAFAASGSAFPVPSATNNGLSVYQIVMTSGAASGQTATIQTNTATGLTLYANGSTALTSYPLVGLTTIPAAGDTFSVFPTPAPDGVHPPWYPSNVISTGIAAPLAALIQPYGAMLGN